MLSVTVPDPVTTTPPPGKSAPLMSPLPEGEGNGCAKSYPAVDFVVADRLAELVGQISRRTKRPIRRSSPCR